MRMFGIIGKKAKYKGLSWWRNFAGGHVCLGRITIYGANAMCWAVTIRTKKFGYLCFSLPSISAGRRREGHYFYMSPNATPWAATFYRGKSKQQRIKADIRRLNLGHNFASSEPETYAVLRAINVKFESLSVRDYEIDKQRS